MCLSEGKAPEQGSEQEPLLPGPDQKGKSYSFGFMKHLMLIAIFL